jgi:transposase-like protein
LKPGARPRGFREELYHRLAVVTLQLPALRERGQDILTLAEHFLARTCQDYGLPRKMLTEDARAALLTYRWPGNVRELANLMERMALLTDIGQVTADLLELRTSQGRPATRLRDANASPTRAFKAHSLQRPMAEAERTRILEALRETGGNISHAADRLGVTRNILRYRLKKYALQASSGTTEPPAPTEPVAPTVEGTPISGPTHVQRERRASLSRPTTPLIGRHGDLNWFAAVWARASRGQAQLALLLGEAGVGKTRLVAELASRDEYRHAEFLVGRGREGEDVLAFSPWVEALRPALDHDVVARLTPITRSDLARLFPEIAEGALPSPLGMEDGPRIFEAVAHLLRLLSSEHAVVVVIEDLHWCDGHDSPLAEIFAAAAWGPTGRSPGYDASGGVIDCLGARHHSGRPA